MKIVALVFLLTFLANISFAEEIVLNPVNDMYTDPSGSSQNVTQLWMANNQSSGNFQRIMIKFDLEPYRSIELKSAVLSLTRFYSCPSSGSTAATIYAISEPWDENTWNFNNHISYYQENSLPLLFSGTGGNVITRFAVDITTLVQLWLNQSIPNYGLVMIANVNQRSSRFYSKEFTNIDFRPYLTMKEEDVSSINTTSINKNIHIHNYPNPFNPVTTIEYYLPIASNVEIKLFNCRGQCMKTFSWMNQPVGEHSLIWNGTDSSGNSVPSGIYLYQIKTEYDSVLKSMVLLK